jgi:hypothetical protein
VWLKTARPRRWCVIGRTKVVATAKKISLTMRSRSEVIKSKVRSPRMKRWSLGVGLDHASASAMRDHIDQPKARKAHQADKNQGNGIYDHAMPILILAFRAFVFREVGDR